MHPIVLIPARLAASRLPDKPLADIAGMPMIVHVWRRAVEADIGPVAVATDSERIAAAVAEAGGRAILTRANHASGSDRVFEALGRLDGSGRHDVVVNLQGDLPAIEPAALRACLACLEEAAVDIATLVALIGSEAERADSNVVKLVGSEIGPGRFRALYFTRATAPWGEGPLYHHIGVYAYRRAALARFVALTPSRLERRERLEQLRALEAGLRIDAALVDHVPLGVDTPADLARARALLACSGTNP